MNLFDIIAISIGLSADAFAVSICKGLSIKNISIKHMIITGLWFGGFQALMPFIGYIIGNSFNSYFIKLNHYIAFIFLFIIGINMIKESFSCDEEIDDSFDFKSLFFLAIATSIDAFVTGITFSLLNVNIYITVIFIGLITFIFSFIGVKIGSIFGTKYKNVSELIGGILLILLALKIVI